MQKEEKKLLNKDQQGHELKQRPNQKQGSWGKRKYLKEQKKKQEMFTDQPIRPYKMTQTSIKQPPSDTKSSRMQNYKEEEEEDDENKSSCVIS